MYFKQRCQMVLFLTHRCKQNTENKKNERSWVFCFAEILKKRTHQGDASHKMRRIVNVTKRIMNNYDDSICTPKDVTAAANVFSNDLLPSTCKKKYLYEIILAALFLSLTRSTWKNNWQYEMVRSHLTYTHAIVQLAFISFRKLLHSLLKAHFTLSCNPLSISFITTFRLKILEDSPGFINVMTLWNIFLVEHLYTYT